MGIPSVEQAEEALLWLHNNAPEMLCNERKRRNSLRREYGRKKNEELIEAMATPAMVSAWWRMEWKREWPAEEWVTLCREAEGQEEKIALALRSKASWPLEKLQWSGERACSFYEIGGSWPRTMSALKGLAKVHSIRKATRQEFFHEFLAERYEKEEETNMAYWPNVSGYTSRRQVYSEVF
jgi:hypothetical protein